MLIGRGPGGGRVPLLLRRLEDAWRTLPGRRDWLHAGALLLIFSLLALPIGYAAGFLQRGSAIPWSATPRIVLTAFLFPTVVEGNLFRVMLLPHPSEKASAGANCFWAFVSLVLYTASHPLNAILFSHAHRPTFTDPAFLLLAALLGLACTLAYLQSGSLWPPVAIHWAVVVVWLLFLGGYRMLNS
jgi:predicted Abi (CAAX) family protease